MFKKGQSGNPAGKKPGTKNRITKPIVQEIIDVARKLEDEGVGLESCARANPEWFFTHIFKNVIPKNVELTGADGGPVIASVEVIFAAAKDKS